MQRRKMRGVHTVLGETMFVNIRIERLSDKQLKALVRRPPASARGETVAE